MTWNDGQRLGRQSLSVYGLTVDGDGACPRAFMPCRHAARNMAFSGKPMSS
jgi:hypothetical protein